MKLNLPFATKRPLSLFLRAKQSSHVARRSTRVCAAGLASLVMLTIGCASHPQLSAPAANALTATNAAAATSLNLEDDRIQHPLDPMEIRPGYLLALKHPVDAKLRVETRVAPDGTLPLPYGRKLQTAGLSLNSLTREIQSLYRDLYQSPGSISVSLVQRKLWVEVRGLVKKPGAKLIDPRMTLEELLAEAEPTGDKPDFARIDLNQRSQLIDLKQYSAGLWPAEKTPAWVGGEVLWFVRGESLVRAGNSHVRLLGEINQPGTFAFQNDKTILDYLSLAGGPKSGANLERVYLYRQARENAGPVELSLLEPVQQQIGPGDTLLFSSERPSTLERRFQLGANLAAILSAIGIIIIAL